MARDLFTECAAQLAASPDLVATLLSQHTANTEGWCRAHNVHPERHPCSIRRLAELAAEGDRASEVVPAARPAYPVTVRTSGSSS